MKTSLKHPSRRYGLWLAVAFAAGMSFMIVLGSGKSSHNGSAQDPPPQLTAKGREMLDQFSVAFESAAAKVNSSVVPIFSEQVRQVENPFASNGDPLRDFFGDNFFKRFFNQPQQQKEVVRALGSGVIVSSDGYILTNNHVVDGAQKLTVMLGDKKKYTAKLIGRDPHTDVAVIKIDVKDLPAATLGNSDNVRVGQWVIAVGNPFELMHTVTAGIISAKGRASVNLADYEDFIQTDAAINPGNSGGALADLDGNVVGINTAIYSPSGGNVGIGFAIPINMARSVMNQLIKHGKVSRGFLGLVPQDIDETMAKAMKLKTTDGALVGDVTSGSPSDKAGVKVGDIITKVNGTAVHNSTELRNTVAAIEPGTKVSLTILRDGKEMTLEATLGERPSDAELAQATGEPSKTSNEKLGFTVEQLNGALAQQLGIKVTKGVVITNVTPGSAADDAGIHRGDLIKQIDGSDVKTIKDFDEAMKSVKSGGSVAFLLQRAGTSFFVAIDVP